MSIQSNEVLTTSEVNSRMPISKIETQAINSVMEMNVQSPPQLKSNNESTLKMQGEGEPAGTSNTEVA